MTRLELWIEGRSVFLSRLYMTLAWLFLPLVFVWAWAALLTSAFGLSAIVLGRARWVESSD